LGRKTKSGPDIIKIVVTPHELDGCDSCCQAQVNLNPFRRISFLLNLAVIPELSR